MKEEFKDLISSTNGFIIDLLIALIIFVVGFRIINIIDKSLKKDNKLTKIDKTAKSIIVSFINISLKVILIVIVLQILGIPSATILTVFGSCAVAIGLALQGGLSNIAGSIMILIFKPFKVGDYIRVNDLEGSVKSISIFYTSITTLDNKRVQLPNGNLSNSNIINYTCNGIRRIDLEFNVSYDTKISNVKKVIGDILDNCDYILKDKNNDVRLAKHDSSSLTFIIRAWINSGDYYETYYYLLEEIKEKFDKNNISIPYPQLDVHIKNK